MRLRKEPAIQVKSPEQIDRMYAAGQVVARTLTVLKEAVRPGVSTGGARRDRRTRDPGGRGRAVVPRATSGIPRSSAPRSTSRSCTVSLAGSRCCKAGDMISIDCGAILDGWHGDSAISLGVGEIDPADQAMLDACEAALCGPGSRRRWPVTGSGTYRTRSSSRCSAPGSTG